MNNGTVVTDGVPVDFGRLTHFNRPISDPATEWLTTVQLDWTLQLYATPGDAVSDVNPIKTIDLTFTIYNWETPNVPASNPAYQVSFDGGATWTTGPAGVCPGSYPVGTLVVGTLGKVYRSDQPDRPDNPVWDAGCGR